MRRLSKCGVKPLPLGMGSVNSDGVNCGYCTDDISLNTLVAEEVEEIPCHCQDCTKTGATSMFPGMLYCREFSTCVSQDEFCKRGQPEAKKDV